jgi:tRNA nucleotidyltransferase (CCA-adding enzyme)
LANGLIRTPLPAFKTFCDDPLRVLRCIRFASRFGFDIVDDIVQAVKEEKIKVVVGLYLRLLGSMQTEPV